MTDRVAFCVGTQINGALHLGTSLVQTAAFLLAKTTKRTFNVDALAMFATSFAFLRSVAYWSSLRTNVPSAPYGIQTRARSGLPSPSGKTVRRRMPLESRLFRASS